VIVLDANVLIALFDPGHVHHRQAERLLRARAEEAKAVSVLTMAEFLVHPAARGSIDEAVRSVALIEVDVLPLPAPDAAPLARVRASSGLKMPDAVVLHAAQTAHGSVMTFDQDLARAATRLGLTVLGPPEGLDD